MADKRTAARNLNADAQSTRNSIMIQGGGPRRGQKGTLIRKITGFPGGTHGIALVGRGGSG